MRAFIVDDCTFSLFESTDTKRIGKVVSNNMQFLQLRQILQYVLMPVSQVCYCGHDSNGTNKIFPKLYSKNKPM